MIAGIDALLELDDERGVARRHDAERAHASARSSFWMNAAEAAVRHDDDEIAGPMLADDGADDVVDRIGLARRRPATCVVVDVRSRTSCGTDSRSASGSFDRKTGAISTSSAPANARAKSSWKMRRHDEADRGSNTAQMRASGFAARRPASVSATAVG